MQVEIENGDLADLADQLSKLATFKLPTRIAVAIAKARVDARAALRRYQRQLDALLDTFAEYDADGRFVLLPNGDVALRDTRGYRAATGNLAQHVVTLDVDDLTAADLPPELPADAIPLLLIVPKTED